MGEEIAKEGVSLLKKIGIPQEGLKIIACLTMLIDHIGATLVPVMALRIIGRMAFPIYCFLLAEGMAHTKNVKKYGIRLAIGAVLAEVPFDLLLYGQLSWMHQSVMVTLLLGFFMTLWIRRVERGQLVPVIIFAVAAELLSADYGCYGMMIIALFVMSRERKDRTAMQAMVLAAVCWFMGGEGWQFGSIYIPMQMCAVAAMVPIWFYSGRKTTNSKIVQWAFYLFYPVHLLVLFLIKMM